MIQVWHIKRHVMRHKYADAVTLPGDSPAQKTAANDLWNVGGYMKVAEIAIEPEVTLPKPPTAALETAWRLTNNVDTSWSMEPDSRVKVTAPLHVHDGKTFGRRSSMVGDVFVVEQDGVAFFFVVAGCGFTFFMSAPLNTRWSWMSEED
jgi:hypothetical protein